MKNRPQVITIDGPAASGKTSVSREVARRLGWNWVSTGAFYRGLAYVATQLKTSLDNQQALSQLCLSNVWEVKMAPERTLVFFEGKDVTDKIYDEDVGFAASTISQYPEVRENLLQSQRSCAEGTSGIVAEGRDCGTVVFPEATVKIFLTAASESRAARRALEQGRDLEETKMAQKIRDKQDKEREAAPMQVPENAHVLDTSQMNLVEVVESVCEILRKELELS